jgi:hypothetical protein
LLIVHAIEGFDIERSFSAEKNLLPLSAVLAS